MSCKTNNERNLIDDVGSIDSEAHTECSINSKRTESTDPWDNSININNRMRTNSNLSIISINSEMDAEDKRTQDNEYTHKRKREIPNVKRDDTPTKKRFSTILLENEKLFKTIYSRDSKCDILFEENDIQNKNVKK